MKKLLLLLLFFFLFTSVMADQTFQHPTLGFGLKYPDDWTAPRQNFAPFLAVYPGEIRDKQDEHFRVEVVNLSGNGGNSMLASMDRRMIEQKYPELKLEKSTPTKLGSIKDAHRFDFVGKHNGKDFHYVRIIGFEGQRAYKVTLGASEANYKRLSYKFDNLLRSFEVK